MSTCRLRSYDSNPPGNYVYTQTEGIHRKFPAAPLIEAQAVAVSNFRSGNGLPRATVQEALRDVDRYNAHRLGCNPAYCVDIDAKTGAPTGSVNSTHPIFAAPCGGCGAVIT
jgi:hypothetical protein